MADPFDGKRDIESFETPVTSDETPVTSDRIGADGPSGECVPKSPRGRRLTARVHQLDTRFGGAGRAGRDTGPSPPTRPGGGFPGCGCTARLRRLVRGC